MALLLENELWFDDNDGTLLLTECANKQMAEKILENWNNVEFQNQLQRSQYAKLPGMQRSTLRNIFKKYLDRLSDDNQIQVPYSQYGRHKSGRMYAVDSMSVQAFPKFIRDALCGWYYTELKMDNSYMTLLDQYLTKYDITHPILHRYVNDKEQLINESKLDTEQFETNFASIFNGYPYDGKDTTLQDFQAETQITLEHIQRLNPEKQPDKIHSIPLISIRDKVVHVLENTVLRHTFNFLTAHGCNPGVLCFDTVLIPKNVPFDQADLSAYILAKTSYNIQFTIILLDQVKTQHLFEEETKDDEVSESIVRYAGRLIYQKHTGLARAFVELYGRKNIKCLDKHGKVYFMWEKRLKLWVKYFHFNETAKISEILENFITDFISQINAKMYQAKSEDERKNYEITIDCLNKILNDVRMSNTINAIARLVPQYCFNPEFRTDYHTTLIPIAGGKVIELRNLLVRPRTRNDHFSQSLNTTYLEEGAPTVTKFMLDIADGNEEEREILQTYLGYSMTGLTSERIIQCLYGLGRNGKSVIISSIRKAVGHLACEVDSSVIFASEKAKSGGQANPALYAIKDINMGFINEIDDREINMSMAKKLSSGGRDGVSVRQLFGFQEEIICKLKMFLIGNEKPNFDASDPAMCGRIRFFFLKKQFPETVESKAYVDEIENNYSDEWLTYLCIGANRFITTGVLPISKSMQEEMAQLITERDPVQQYINDYCIVSEDEVYPTTQFLVELNTAMSTTLTPQKLNKIMIDRKGFTKKKAKHGGKPEVMCYIGIGKQIDI